MYALFIAKITQIIILTLFAFFLPSFKYCSKFSKHIPEYMHTSIMYLYTRDCTFVHWHILHVIYVYGIHAFEHLQNKITIKTEFTQWVVKKVLKCHRQKRLFHTDTDNNKKNLCARYMLCDDMWTTFYTYVSKGKKHTVILLQLDCGRFPFVLVNGRAVFLCAR